MRFIELLYRALMDSVIRTELLAASSWLPGKLASLRHECLTEIIERKRRRRISLSNS